MVGGAYVLFECIQATRYAPECTTLAFKIANGDQL